MEASYDADPMDDDAEYDDSKAETAMVSGASATPGVARVAVGPSYGLVVSRSDGMLSAVSSAAAKPDAMAPPQRLHQELSQPPRASPRSPIPSLPSASLTPHAATPAGASFSIRPNAAAIAISDFECSICYCLLCEPITVPCGHTFCRVCLVASLERSKKKCPECRAPCHIEGRFLLLFVTVNATVANSFGLFQRKRTPLTCCWCRSWRSTCRRSIDSEHWKRLWRSAAGVKKSLCFSARFLCSRISRFPCICLNRATNL